MISSETFYRIVRGEKRDFSATLARAFLSLLEVPYVGITAARNFLYDAQIFRATHVGVPTISVGNLTLGGTGKSPFVAWLVAWSEENSRRAGVVSRGYRASRVNDSCARHDEKINDEAKELAQRFASLPQRHSPNRIRAARELLAENDIDFLILDDAFQHRRIARDLNVLLLDATAPWGFNHLFPRGTLRESIYGMRRAEVVILSRAAMIDESEREKIRARVLAINPHAIWCETTPTVTKKSREFLQNQRVVAFCGIGNPQGFRHTLQEADAEIIEFLTFGDHHHFTAADLSQLQKLSQQHAAPLVCTGKDRVKLPDDFPAESVEITLNFLAGEESLRTQLTHIVMPLHCSFPRTASIRKVWG